MAKVWDSFQKELEVKEPLRLEVETGSGNIEVRRGEGGRLRVTGKFWVRARSEEEARRLAAQIKADPPIELEGDLVRIGDLGRYELGPWPFGPAVAIDFAIEAPAGTAARLRSGSGDQEVKGLRGPLTIEAGSGDVEIEGVEAEVKVTTSSGDIEVADVQAAVEAEAGSGDLTLERIAGPVKIRVGSGDVSLKGIESDLAVEAGSGDIMVDSGLGGRARWELSAGSGDVRLRLPKGSQFKLHVKTGSGDFNTDFPLTPSGKLWKEIEGQVGENPTAGIRIKTSSGDISIRAR